MPPIGFIAATPGFSNGGGIGFLVPSTAKEGDVLIAIVACTDTSTALHVTGADFDLLVRLEQNPPASGRGQIFVYRHVVTGAEGAQLNVFTDINPTKGAGAMLLYRGMARDVTLVASGTANVVASTNFVCPSETLVTYSDLYLGIAFVEAAVAVTQPAGTTERSDAAGVFGACQLEVFDLLRELVGATGTKTATTAGAQSGMAASVALAALPVLVAPAVDPDVPGAIGLVTVGV